jgi:hypothetical protein
LSGSAGIDLCSHLMLLCAEMAEREDSNDDSNDSDIPGSYELPSVDFSGHIGTVLTCLLSYPQVWKSRQRLVPLAKKSKMGAGFEEVKGLAAMDFGRGQFAGEGSPKSVAWQVCV